MMIIMDVMASQTSCLNFETMLQTNFVAIDFLKSNK